MSSTCFEQTRPLLNSGDNNNKNRMNNNNNNNGDTDNNKMVPAPRQPIFFRRLLLLCAVQLALAGGQQVAAAGGGGHLYSVAELRGLAEGYEEAAGDEFAREMESYLEVEHYFTKSRPSGDSYKVMKAANLQATIALISHSIRARASEALLASDGLLVSKSADRQDDDDRDDKAPELATRNLMLARVLARAKATELAETRELWQRAYHLVRQHPRANGMGEVVWALGERLKREPLNMEGELARLSQAWQECKSALAGEEADTFFARLDDRISRAFSSNAGDQQQQQGELKLVAGVPELASGELVAAWATTHVDQELKGAIERNERAYVTKLEESPAAEWQHYTLEEIERELLGSDDSDGDKASLAAT